MLAVVLPLVVSNTRPLGSMESLFAPRAPATQPTVHVMAAVVAGRCPDLQERVARVAAAQPMLRARLRGTGAPRERTRLGSFTVPRAVHRVLPFLSPEPMVRVGDSPDPLRFVIGDASHADHLAHVDVRNLGSDGDVDAAWREHFRWALDAPIGEEGLLWGVTAFVGDDRTALVFRFNHAISDQTSATSVLRQILDDKAPLGHPDALPPSLETSVLGDVSSEGFSSGLLALEHGTAPYLLEKAGEKAAGVLPPGERVDGPRRSAPVFFTIDEATTAAAIAACRSRGLTLTPLLAAAAAVAAQDMCAGSEWKKVLVSLDMRRFGSYTDTETLCCQAGSFDVVTRADEDDIWKIARDCQRQLRDFVDNGRPKDAVLVFDWAMRSFEMTRLVDLEADNPLTLGRAYAAGVSNVGRVDDIPGLEALHFAVPHARTGALLPFSCATVDGRLHVTLNAPEPLVTPEQRDRAVDVFSTVVGGTLPTGRGRLGRATALAAAAALVAAPVAVTFPAWANLVRSFGAIWAAGAMDADLAPLKFWTLFAVAHPLLQPALWVSELLHSPVWVGPVAFGLVPVSFIAASVAAASAVTTPVRNALATAFAAAFVATVSYGVGSTAPDYNLALDDGIKGCPAYEDVRQPSMAGFDVSKYQGRWYELAFHDWTQFDEVYATTLDIELDPTGTRWVDDFGVRGPSPDAAPHSWDKSPVAEGAHYFLYGRVDSPGVLQESGFGLTFPNFIVDVERDAEGNYQRAIQFQCLERGGVRIFEGINFLSRTTDNLPAQMAKLHERATRAGLDPYGADQMHVVDQRPLPPGAMDNAWQNLWRAVGVDKALGALEAAMHTAAEGTGN